MTRRLACLLIALLLILQSATARASAPPQLIAYAVQRDAAATLVVGVVVTAPTEVTIGVQLPPGWSGAPTSWSGVVTSTLLLSYPIVRGNAPPGLGAIRVVANGVERDAWVRGPVIESAPPRRAGRVLLPVVRR